MADINELREDVEKIMKDYPLPKQIYDYVAQQIDIPEQVTFKPLRSENCSDCGNMVYHPKQEINRTLWGTGEHKKDVMFVLQNPGVSKSLKNEKFRGITRTGISCAGGGAILRWVAKLGGYDFDKDIYTTNCVKCCTTENKKPKSIVQKNCYPFLKQEIKEVNPNNILTFGKLAQKNVERAIKELNRKDIQVKNFFHHSYAINRQGPMMNKHGKNFTDWVIEIVDFLNY